MASTWCFGGLNIPSTKWWDSGDNELLSSLNKWWDSNNNEIFSSWHICDDTTGYLNTCHLSYCGLECVTRILKIKRSKHPWAYYSNSSTTFHDCLLEGDLVFTLNRGPMDREDISTSHFHCFHTHHVFLSSRSRNPSNLITVNRLPFNKISNSILSLCLLNSFASVTLILSLLQRVRLTIKMMQFRQNFVQMDTIYWIRLAFVGKEAVQLFCSGTCLRLKKRVGD